MINSAKSDSILQLMSAEDKALLLSLGHSREYKEKTSLFHKGEIGRSFYIIVSGAVVISVTSVDGREVILNKLKMGDVFGEIAMFDAQARTADAVVAANTNLITIDRSRFFEFLDQKPSLYHAIIKFLCARLRYCAMQVESFALADSRGRLIAKLLYLAEEEKSENKAIVKVSQGDLAKMLGLSREAVNKALQQIQTEGLVILQQAKIIIPDIERLMSFEREGEF